MRSYHQGTYDVINRGKYIGKEAPTYRSSWEKMVFKWLDLNPDVTAWNSEAVVIPYLCPTDGQIHRYYVDLCIKYRSGNVVLVEIKPEYQINKPKAKSGKTKARLLEENATWEKNQAKWKAADAYAKRNGHQFQVWGETVLQAIGVPINTSRPDRFARKPNK